MFPCFLLFCHLGESISLDLFYFVNLTSSCSFIPPCTLSHVKTSETLWFLVSENWDTLTLSLMESGETLLARSCVKTGETLWLLAIWKPWDTDWDALNHSNLETNWSLQHSYSVKHPLQCFATLSWVTKCAGIVARFVTLVTKMCSNDKPCCHNTLETFWVFTVCKLMRHFDTCSSRN